MDPDTFEPSDVIHLFVMEIDLDYLWETLMVLQLLMMMRWGNFQMRSSLTCLRGMMKRNRLSLTTSMTQLLNLQHGRTLEVLQKVLPMLTMQMALQISQQMTLLLNMQTMLPKVLPMTILEISHMTLLLNL